MTTTQAAPNARAGIFSEGSSIFDDVVSNPNDAEVTRGQEAGATEQPTGRPGAPNVPPEQAGTQQLVAFFDANGQVFVAYTEGGNRIEEWREPTKEEWGLLESRGQLVRGGLTSGVTGGNPGGLSVQGGAIAGYNGGGIFGAVPEEGMTTGKWIAVAAAVAAVAAGGWYVYNKYASEDEELDEDADEV
jgi:hypothetical protein